MVPRGLREDPTSAPPLCREAQVFRQQNSTKTFSEQNPSLELHRGKHFPEARNPRPKTNEFTIEFLLYHHSNINITILINKYPANPRPLNNRIEFLLKHQI